MEMFLPSGKTLGTVADYLKRLQNMLGTVADYLERLQNTLGTVAD